MKIEVLSLDCVEPKDVILFCQEDSAIEKSTYLRDDLVQVTTTRTLRIVGRILDSGALKRWP